jgi:molybdate transport system substrate-binding protein
MKGIRRSRIDRRHHGLVLVTLLSLCLGCGSGGPAPNKLVFHCGAGLQPAADELAKQFGRRHGVTVECDYAGSEVLMSRIKLARRGDLYMPGDVHYVELAEKEGLVASKRTACYFVPVILVQKGNPKNIRTLRDLAAPGVAVGLGNPEACAIGRKSSRIFRKNNIPEGDLDVKFRTLTVNELGIHIEMRKLDAVIVWDAVAAYFADAGDTVAIPREQNIISTVAVGILKFSEHPELAEKFVEFATSEEGRAIFKKHGYSTTLPE